MPYMVAGVVIKKDDRYLMVQERNPKCYGQWNWPAGHVDVGETPEQGAVREAKEEVGLDVVLGEKIGEWQYSDKGRTIVLFAAQKYSGELRTDPGEILGAAWLTRDEIIALRRSMRLSEWSDALLADGTI